MGAKGIFSSGKFAAAPPTSRLRATQHLPPRHTVDIANQKGKPLGIALHNGVFTRRVVVASVQKHSYASDVLAAGDAIVLVNGVEIWDAEQAARLLSTNIDTHRLVIRPRGDKVLRQLAASFARLLDASARARMVLSFLVAYAVMWFGGWMLYRAEHSVEYSSACTARITENKVRSDMRLPPLEDQGCRP